MDDADAQEFKVLRLLAKDVIVDALDSGKNRLSLSELCRELGIPMIHWAMAVLKFC